MSFAPEIKFPDFNSHAKPAPQAPSFYENSSVDDTDLNCSDTVETTWLAS